MGKLPAREELSELGILDPLAPPSKEDITAVKRAGAAVLLAVTAVGALAISPFSRLGFLAKRGAVGSVRYTKAAGQGIEAYKKAKAAEEKKAEVAKR